MALSRPTANASVGTPKELAAPPASQAAVYISPSLHPRAVRSPDLSYSVSISPTFLELKAQATAAPLANRYMELPQPQHSSEGSKPPHDFLSLYGGTSSNLAEHRSTQGLSTYLTTQDFLQPLERGGKNTNNNSSRGSEPSSADGSGATSTSSVEHVLPGGIGTYSISHISSFGQANGKSETPPPPPPPHHAPMLHHHVNVAESKPEVGRVAASSAPAFALWEERVHVLDGNRTPDIHVKAADAATAKEYLEKSMYWTTARPKAELSFLSKNSFNLESTQQPSPSLSKQRPQTGQGFVEMMKSIKPISEDEDDDDEEFVDRSRENRKESSSQKVEAQPKIEGKSNDQKANTPRSKHSATEQRRRSKINDRFQTLRDLVPHSDQKRDKASFLLEVIEYIQVLQEKVRKYEATEQSWNQERMKTMVWDLCKKSPGHGDSPGDGSRTLVGTVLDCKQNNEVSEPNKPRTSNAMHDEISSATDSHPNSQNLLQHSKPNTVMPGCPPPYKEKENSGVFSKSVPLTLSMQQCVYSPFGMNFPHPIHLKPQAASEIHSLTTVPGINHGCMPINVYPFDRDKDANSTAPVLLSRFQDNASNILKTTNGLENQLSDLRSSQSSSIPQDPGRNGGISVKDENADTKSAAKPDQHSDPYFNSSARLSQFASQSEAELANKQLQTQSSSPDQHRANDARLPTSEQEQLVIQGGVINVSSIYSQGLLDTLTQALQNSGLDLSQANISVQIDLSRQAVTSGARTNNKEQSHNQEESSQNHQLHGHPRSTDTFSEEQPQKRPKIEKDI